MRKSHGGRRLNAGRKRIHSPGVAHRSREMVNSRVPLHINFKYRMAIRNKDRLRLLKRAILNARKKGMHVIHYALQKNHVHLIVECANNSILTAGMRSITVTMSQGIDAGKSQLGRYHLHVLKSLRETKNALRYVLFNEQKHTKLRLIKMTGFCSLHFHQDLRAIAKNWKMLLLWSDVEGIYTKGKSYLLKRAEEEFTSSFPNTASATWLKYLYP